jgi:hypothetical protein
MQFCIKTHTGTLLFRGNLNGDTQIRDIKKRIARQWFVPVDVQKLLFSGKILDNWRTLDDYYIWDGATIIMINKMAYGYSTKV